MNKLKLLSKLLKLEIKKMLDNKTFLYLIVAMAICYILAIIFTLWGLKLTGGANLRETIKAKEETLKSEKKYLQWLKNKKRSQKEVLYQVEKIKEIEREINQLRLLSSNNDLKTQMEERIKMMENALKQTKITRERFKMEAEIHYLRKLYEKKIYVWDKQMLYSKNGLFTASMANEVFIRFLLPVFIVFALLKSTQINEVKNKTIRNMMLLPCSRMKLWMAQFLSNSFVIVSTYVIVNILVTAILFFSLENKRIDIPVRIYKWQIIAKDVIIDPSKIEFMPIIQQYISTLIITVVTLCMLVSINMFVNVLFWNENLSFIFISALLFIPKIIWTNITNKSYFLLNPYSLYVSTEIANLEISGVYNIPINSSMIYLGLIVLWTTLFLLVGGLIFERRKVY